MAGWVFDQRQASVGLPPCLKVAGLGPRVGTLTPLFSATLAPSDAPK